MSLQTQTQPSRKKRTPADRLHQAVQNGFTPESSSCNGKPVYKRLADLTKRPYEDMLALWQFYLQEHPTKDPTQFQTLKHFFEMVALQSRGTLNNGESDYATTHSLKTQARQLRGALKRAKDQVKIEKEVLDMICNYIDGPLKEKLNLSSARRKATYLTIDNYVSMMEYFWGPDHHTYRHEGVRIQNSALFNTHAYTSARLAELCQSTFEHLQCIIGWKGSEPDLKIGYTREFTKGLMDDPNKPKHPLYEQLEPTPPLYAQPLIFYIPIILSRNAFKKYKTIVSVLDARPPENERYQILDWEDDALKIPVFPVLTGASSAMKSRTPSSWGTDFKDWVSRAGFQAGTLHSLRREALIKADDQYSLSQVMKFASHKSSNTLGRHYLDSMSNVDGAATYLDLQARHDVTKDFRSATMQRKYGLPLSLPESKQNDLESRSDYQALTEKSRALVVEIEKAENDDKRRELKRQQEELDFQKRKLRDQELKDYQSNYKEPSQGQQNLADWRRDYFQHVVRHMVPERARLSENLLKCEKLRSEVGRSVMEDLLYLLTNDSPVAYQESLRPINGRCRVESCGAEMDSIPIFGRWRHAYDCCKADHERLSGCMVRYCFICNSWEKGEREWDDHCVEHIRNGEIPFRCDPITYRHGLARAGHCRVCLHDEKLSASDRLHQYMHLSDWKRHEETCMDAYLRNCNRDQLFCPDPRCKAQGPFPSTTALYEHQEDNHSCHQRQLGRRKRPRSDSSEIEAQENTPRPKQRKRPHKFITYSPGVKRKRSKRQPAAAQDPDSEDSDLGLCSTDEDYYKSSDIDTDSPGSLLGQRCAEEHTPEPEVLFNNRKIGDMEATMLPISGITENSVLHQTLASHEHTKMDNLTSTPKDTRTKTPADASMDSLISAERGTLDNSEVTAVLEELYTPRGKISEEGPTRKEYIEGHSFGFSNETALDPVTDEEEYEVERCLAVRIYNRILQYRVKWVDYEEDEPRWYDAANFKGAAGALRDFHQQNPHVSGPPKRLSHWLDCWTDGVEAGDHEDDNVPEKIAKRGRRAGWHTIL